MNEHTRPKSMMPKITLSLSGGKGMKTSLLGHLTPPISQDGTFVLSFIIAGRGPAYSGPQR